MFKKKVTKKSKFHKCTKCGMETPLFSCPNCSKDRLEQKKEEQKFETVIKFDNPVGNLTKAEKRKLRRLKRKGKV